MDGQMDENQAAQRREAVVLHPFTNQTKTYNGDQIYSITEKGLVICTTSETRTFYPWNRVNMFNYHARDVQARRIIQGW
jgi:hypothetical protein